MDDNFVPGVALGVCVGMGMTNYNTLDNYIEDTVTGVLTRQFTKTEFLLENEKLFYCIFPTYLADDAKANLSKQITVTGLVEMYCGNAERMEEHIYEMIVREIK